MEVEKTGGKPNSGVWICPANAIHTIGMMFSFDLVLIDKATTLLVLSATVNFPFLIGSLVGSKTDPCVLLGAKAVTAIKNPDPTDWSIDQRNLRPGDVHVEGHVEIAFVRRSTGSPGGYRN
jgi:hypothetical protein